MRDERCPTHGLRTVRLHDWLTVNEDYLECTLHDRGSMRVSWGLVLFGQPHGQPQHGTFDIAVMLCDSWPAGPRVGELKSEKTYRLFSDRPSCMAFGAAVYPMRASDRVMLFADA